MCSPGIAALQALLLALSGPVAAQPAALQQPDIGVKSC